LSLDDCFSLLELLSQLPVLPFQPGDFQGHWIRLFGLSTPLFGTKALQGSLVTLPPPSADIGVIETFPSWQGTDFAWLTTCFVLPENAQFVCGAKASSGLFFRHFRVRR